MLELVTETLRQYVLPFSAGLVVGLVIGIAGMWWALA